MLYISMCSCEKCIYETLLEVRGIGVRLDSNVKDLMEVQVSQQNLEQYNLSKFVSYV